jgi:dTDP-4-amino-4,6-dideoxygalactose transaminase
MIKNGEQFIDKYDISEVKRSLKQDLITTGKYVVMFEKKIEKLFSCNFALSCNSGTAGLSLAFQALNLKQNDNVILPVINFIAAYSTLKAFNVNVFFADVCPLSGQMTPETLLMCIEKNKLKNVKLFLTMYLGGSPENIEDFYKIKKKYDCLWVEDACHALGSRHTIKKKRYYIGSGKFADLSVFSLHPIKTITSGEGGFVTTNNKKFYQSMKLFRSHGIIRSKHDNTRYDIKKLGLNYRLSDINCALAFSQLKKINKFITNRKKIALIYKKNLIKLKKYITTINYSKKSISSWHLFIIHVNQVDKNKLINYLFKKKIITQFHYIPIYRFSFFKKENHALRQKFPEAEKYYKTGISLPIFYRLSEKNQIKIIKIISNFISNYEKKI